MFKNVTPESVGIESERVLGFIKALDECRMHTHSIIMARGDGIFAECYYEPFSCDTLHRMYSVSKSFITVAVGLAVTEGILSLDESVVKYFPEFSHDEYAEECTVRDMLTMQSNIGSPVAWWGRFATRVDAYFSLKTEKVPGTVYFYDSIGCFLLNCIIEKKTGMDFLEYLKDRVLLELGFSKESYTLREPGGYTVGDSGVMCTSRDLFILARLIMKRGLWDGVQYIDREFMEEAVKKQSHNDLMCNYDSYGNRGYGYLIWKTHPDGFSLVGMGDQLAVCDTKRDLTFIITSDNQGERAARHVIYHEYYRHFIEYAGDLPLPENSQAALTLSRYLDSRRLVAQYGERTSVLAPLISGVRYKAQIASQGITAFTLTLGDTEGCVTLEMGEVTHTLEFGLSENKLTDFSFGQRARPDMMGVYEEGKYRTSASGAWVSDHAFTVMAQVIDTYLGCLCLHISYKDRRATLSVSRYGQYVFEDMGGYVIAAAE